MIRLLGFFLSALLLLSAPANASPAVVFLGDSLTAWGPWKELFPGRRIYNLGVPGDTTDGLKRRLGAALSAAPARLFVMGGANDLWMGREPERILENLRSIVERVRKESPRTRLYLLSVLPVNDRRFEVMIDNADVARVNRGLEAMAQSSGAVYIDLASEMMDDSGRLHRDLTVDGVHLKPAAYKLWGRAVAPFLED